MVDWEAVPCGSKSFSPRRGRVWGADWEGEERVVRRRKSWVSSVGSGEAGRGEWEGEGGGEVIVAVGSRSGFGVWGWWESIGCVLAWSGEFLTDESIVVYFGYRMWETKNSSISIIFHRYKHK